MNRYSKYILLLLALCLLPVFTVASQNQKTPGTQKKYILGFYRAEADNGELYKLALYRDGYFLERVYNKANSQWFSYPGTYATSSDNTQIELNYLGYEESWSESASFTSGGELQTEKVLYRRIRDSVSSIESEDEIVGSYLFEYYQEEEVLILLSFNRSGSFIEKQFYPETQEVYEEYGHYELSVPSGSVFLSYEEWTEGDCLGFFNTQKGELYLPDGDYRKTLAQSDDFYLNQGF